MAIGQAVLGGATLDVAELDRLGAAMEVREQRRAVDHAAQLTDALAIRRVYADAGMPLSAAAQVALLLSCSENRAEHLLHEAATLRGLGALDTMRTGLLTVEQGRVVVDLLGPVDDALAGSLWERLAVRLEADRAQGIVRPPARLRELLNRWLIAADPEAAAARRKDSAQVDAGVELWKRGDGLTDLVGRALTPADAIACSDRLELLAQPLGPDDVRTHGQRRQAALVDLLLGRTVLPFDDATREDVGGCCPPGSSAPCGAQIFVHVPVATADGEGTEPAELVGHGPIDAALLADLLRAAPVLRRVWVDRDTGVPVAVDDQVWTPGRDPDAIRRALAEMRTGPPPDVRHPMHPDDHPPDRPAVSTPAPRALTRPHLADPGGYVPPRRLKQLLRARAPRCEWPGCGRRASRAAGSPCDLDHDLAWPFGPTCACNIGPLCRRHHRIKQEGWGKQRQSDGSVRWTDPTGRAWLSPSQHPKPQPRPQRRRVAPGVWTVAA